MNSITRGLSFFVDPRGRVSRSAFWFGFQAVWLFSLVVTANIDHHIIAGGDPGFYSLTTLFLIASIWPTIAVGIKRFHDLNMSGWWQIALIASWFSPTSGPWVDESTIGKFFFGGVLIASILLGLIPNLGIGTKGKNRFGENPLEAEQ